jgi:hypothetical protein
MTWEFRYMHWPASQQHTMQLMVTVAGTEVRALVDLGSTHTFIHDEVVHHLGL